MKIGRALVCFVTAALGIGAVVACLPAASEEPVAVEVRAKPADESCGAKILAIADAAVSDGNASAPADCDTTKTAVYCGCLWDSQGWKSWADPTQITEVGCNTPGASGGFGTPYYRKPPPPPPECICPSEPGDVVTQNNCPQTDVNACSGLGWCTIQRNGQTFVPSCNYPPGYPTADAGGPIVH